MATYYQNNGPVTNAGDVGRDIINIQGIDAEHVNLHLPKSMSLDDVWEMIKREVLFLTGNTTGPMVAAAVKSLGEKIQLKLEKDNKRLHYMIFNLIHNYRKSLNGFIDYQEHYIHGILFGVWIFECGQFENLGIGSYENWTFGGYNGGNWARSGEPIKFFRNSYFPFFHKYGAEGRLVTFSKI